MLKQTINKMEENNKDKNSTEQNWNTPENNPASHNQPPYRQDNKKVLAGVLGILFGGLGIHKFILGYNQEGFILLGITLISIPLSCLAIGLLTIYIPIIIGLIEGIIYLTKTDEEFYQTYQVGKKPWF